MYKLPFNLSRKKTKKTRGSWDLLLKIKIIFALNISWAQKCPRRFFRGKNLNLWNLKYLNNFQVNDAFLKHVLIRYPYTYNYICLGNRQGIKRHIFICIYVWYIFYVWIILCPIVYLLKHLHFLFIQKNNLRRQLLLEEVGRGLKGEH